MSDKQIQRAGDNSCQIQTQSIIQINGITEERARVIVNEQCDAAVHMCLQESRLIAEKRINEFKTELFSSMSSRPELFSALQEPSCVDSFGKAANAAVRTNSKEDKKLLAELLTRRFEEPDDRHVAAGINKAIEVVELLTEEELAGVTLYFAYTNYIPRASSVVEGLDTLEKLFCVLIPNSLPSGQRWIDDLDMYDVVRGSQLSKPKSLSEYYFERLSGYTVCGLEVGSEQEKIAVQKLADSGIPRDALIDHELNPGFKRLPLVEITNYSNLHFERMLGDQCISVSLSSNQLDTISQIAEMCQSEQCRQKIKTNLEEMIQDRPNLRKLSDWLNAMPIALRVTSAGRYLANANARRLDPTLPDIDC